MTIEQAFNSMKFFKQIQNTNLSDANAVEIKKNNLIECGALRTDYFQRYQKWRCFFVEKRDIREEHARYKCVYPPCSKVEHLAKDFRSRQKPREVSQSSVQLLSNAWVLGLCQCIQGLFLSVYPDWRRQLATFAGGKMPYPLRLRAWVPPFPYHPVGYPSIFFVVFLLGSFHRHRFEVVSAPVCSRQPSLHVHTISVLILSVCLLWVLRQIACGCRSYESVLANPSLLSDSAATLL